MLSDSNVVPPLMTVAPGQRHSRWHGQNGPSRTWPRKAFRFSIDPPSLPAVTTLAIDVEVSSLLDDSQLRLP